MHYNTSHGLELTYIYIKDSQILAIFFKIITQLNSILIY